MIARHWKGLVKSDLSEAYLEHLKVDTLNHVEKLDGFKSAVVLKSDLSEGVEFVVITKWDSLDSIKQFAGDDIEKAVVPKKAEAMMIRYDDRVKHYEVVATV
ncbi:MAG: antibiotic biosynthesis monooxygenase [Bacteroidota bacterium]